MLQAYTDLTELLKLLFVLKQGCIHISEIVYSHIYCLSIHMYVYVSFFRQELFEGRNHNFLKHFFFCELNLE